MTFQCANDHFALVNDFLEKFVALERVRSARYIVMALLLDFEEKWKYSFKEKYKHGLSC